MRVCTGHAIGAGRDGCAAAAAASAVEQQRDGKAPAPPCPPSPHGLGDARAREAVRAPAAGRLSADPPRLAGHARDFYPRKFCPSDFCPNRCAKGQGEFSHFQPVRGKWHRCRGLRARPAPSAAAVSPRRRRAAGRASATRLGRAAARPAPAHGPRRSAWPAPQAGIH